MAEWNLEEADAYIELNTVDNEDWFDAEETRKKAFLNVSLRTLKTALDMDEVPDEAVYLFAPILAFTYNDTNKMAQQGVASFSIRGISFTFKDWSKRQIRDFVPDEIYEMVGKPRRQLKDTVM